MNKIKQRMSYPYYYLKSVNDKYKLIKFQRQWRKRNKNNLTKAASIFSIDKVSVGNYSYGTLNIISYYNDQELLQIGNFCSIASTVLFVLGGEHSYCNLSTYPFKRNIISGKFESITKGPIIVEDDVWIGERATILSGVTLGQGSVIAAGSVVTKSVEPYSIVGGTPASFIKYRFNPDVIKYLMTLDYSKLTKKMLLQHQDILYKSLDCKNVQDIKEDLLWFPKKEI